MVFSPGDSIYFKSGDYWEGMFWLKGSGSSTDPIVVDVYGGNIKPIINGYGYQSSILIFNDQHIEINGLEIFNSSSHLDAGPSTILEQTPGIFANGPNSSTLYICIGPYLYSRALKNISLFQNLMCQ